MAVAIMRTELDATGLREAARRSKDAAASRRMLALALVLEGSNRTEAARAAGMDRQTLRDWVHRYNAEGIAGLSDAPRSGRPPALSEDRLQELKELVLAGPDLERTVGKLLRRIGLTRVQPRPYHPKKDADAQAAFKKTSLPA